MQMYRPASHNKSNSNPTYGQNSLTTQDRSGENVPICQICHKSRHIADACWHRYIENYVPQLRHFGRGRGQRSAYMASFEPQTDFVAPYENSYGVDYSSYPMTDVNSSSSFSTPGATYIANYEGPADKGWYLDSRATHHLTNHMANMYVREQFHGPNKTHYW